MSSPSTNRARIAPAGRLTAALLGALLCAAALVISPSALAAEPVEIGTFKTAELPEEHFFANTALAVDEATGDVYVLDHQYPCGGCAGAEGAIDRFNANGEYLSRIKGEDTAAKSFNFGEDSIDAIAVDNSPTATQGDLYVVSAVASLGDSPAVFAFDSAGNELWEQPGYPGPSGTGSRITCGVAVDPSGNPWVLNRDRVTLDELSPATGDYAGNTLIPEGVKEPCTLAFDSSADFYTAAGLNTHTPTKYDSNGVLMHSLSVAKGTIAYQLSVDPRTDSVFAALNEAGLGYKVRAWSSSGDDLWSIPGINVRTVSGVAVDGTRRRLYVSENYSFSTTEKAVRIFQLPALFELEVAKEGSGSGEVTSSPSGIECGSRCSAEFEEGTAIVLTAAADPGSQFSGWSGCDSEPSADECEVELSEAKAVTASFEPAKFTLTVAKAGTGSGTVTSSPAGIACGATCSAEFKEGEEVTLSAASATGNTFAGWSGACAGTGACKVTMSEARAATATFDLIPPLEETCATNPALCPPPPKTCATDPSLCPPPPVDNLGQCIATANKAFARAKRAARKKHGEAKAKALRAAGKRHRKAIAACKAQFG